MMIDQHIGALNAADCSIRYQNAMLKKQL